MPSVDDKRRALLARRLRERADRPQGTGQTRAAGLAECVIPLRAGEGTPLFLLPAVGGGAGPYVALVEHLPPGRPVYGLESPGLHGQSIVYKLDELAAVYLDLITGIRPDGPYLLCGWSVGGVVAQEIAVRLRERAADVPLVVMLDSALAPSEPPPDDTTVLGWFAEDLSATLRAEPPDLAFLHALPEDERTDGLIEALENAGTVPSGIRAEMRQRIAAFAGNARAYRSWRPRPVDVPVTFVLAEDTDAGEVDRWRPYASAVTCLPVPGAHHTMLQHPDLDKVVDALSRCLGEADPRSP
ncbi:thioesterase domain-containing protein [Actinocrispum wychmicini]|uniref:Thioesterase domain-containing protein n=1 Tax=Actinocrispum wychmicini TaxID=1213861 RepID=A0A4R2JPD8_9PSEU|nr:thioesterase domain-containing protein [Actinocrispum wychmicini]TCO60857.1 thioesterase domain-containing protein [Actinocrispum wychmicini]